MLRHHLLAVSTALLLMVVGTALGGLTGFVLGAVAYFALALSIRTWGSRLILRWLDAKPVGSWLPAAPHQRLLDSAAERMGIESPELFVTEGTQVNAFAIAIGPSTAVCVTRGFVEMLSRDQAAAVFALHSARIRVGVAEEASHATIVAGLLGHAASFGRPGLFEHDRNPFGLPTVAIVSPLGALLARALVSGGREREATRLAKERIGRPEVLGQVIARAEIMSCMKPLRLPAALATTALVSPHLGAAQGSVARVHAPRISGSARLELLETRTPDSDMNLRVPRAA